MRIKIQTQPYLSSNSCAKVSKIVEEYQERYNRISALLDSIPAILDAFHEDIKDVDSPAGRGSTFSSEQFLRMGLIKTIEGLSMRDAIIRVSDSSFLRHFTRIGMGPVMTYTALDMILKRIRPETWKKINALLSDDAQRGNKITGKRLRIDSTVCESNIHYPTDASLLFDCYRVASRLMQQGIDAMPGLGGENRFHVVKAKQRYTFIATHGGRKRASAKREVLRQQKKLTGMVAWICDVGRTFVARAKTKCKGSVEGMGLVSALEEMLPHMARVVACAQKVNAGETVPASERIFSIFEPHTELLMRGKAHKPVEFGHMVSIGQTDEKFISFYEIEEKSRHDIQLGDEAIEAHKKQFGAYPQEFAADKNYYGGPEHSTKWRERIRVYSVGKKGRRDAVETKREHGVMFRLLQKFRAGCEGSISALKRVFGLCRCLYRGFNSFASSVGCTVFCHNLVVVCRQ